MNAGQFFGTIQESVMIIWRMHLKTNKHDEHVILNDYYDDVQDMIDNLIEHYMGINGKIEHYENLIEYNITSSEEYLRKLRLFIKNNMDKFCVDELKSDIDDILGLIDSTLYKLVELSGVKPISLKTYVKNY